MKPHLQSLLGPGSLIVACCAIAASPLVFAPTFALDWVNHGWCAAYVTHVLTAQWAVPMFVNTPALIGNPVLVFYGTALYTVLSPFVWLFGPDVGMRLAVGAALVMPTFAMARFFLALGVDRFTATCLTICLSTSVYQLTNIYTRGAVTEFFAYQFILLGAIVLLGVLASQELRRSASKLVFGFASLALGALAHPPTFATAGLFLGPPVLVLATGMRSAAVTSIRRHPVAWAVAAATLVPVALWLQITVVHRDALGVTQGYSDFLYFPLSIDHWIARFWPFPIDLRVLTGGFNLVSTPFLSAPVNSMALLVAALALVGRFFRPLASTRLVTGRVFAATVSLAIIAPLLLSLPIVRTELIGVPDTQFAGTVRALPGSTTATVLGSIQLAYRLVNIVNLAAIMAVLGIALLRSRAYHDRPEWHPLRSAWRYLLIAAATISIAAIGSKVLDVHLEFVTLPRISQQTNPAKDGNKGAGGNRAWAATEAIEANRLAMRTVDQIPSTQYGLSLYGMPRIHRPYVGSADQDELTATLTMVDRSGARAEAQCPRRCALLTNLVASRWATVTIDGERVPPRLLKVRPGALVTILAEPGTHQIEVQLGSWQTAALSWSILGLVVLFWTSGLAVLVGSRAVASGGGSTQPAPTT